MNKLQQNKPELVIVIIDVLMKNTIFHTANKRVYAEHSSP